MGTIASQITSLTIVYSTVYWDADQRKYQSCASLAFTFPAQIASSAENVSIWWRHHDTNGIYLLTHWGRVTHICVCNLTIVGSDNGLSPDRRQAITRTSAGILLTGPLGTYVKVKFNQNAYISFNKCIWKRHLRNSGHFVSASMC